MAGRNLYNLLTVLRRGEYGVVTGPLVLVWLTSSGDYRMLSIVQQDWQSLRNIVCVNTRKFKIYLTGCLVDQEIIP